MPRHIGFIRDGTTRADHAVDFRGVSNAVPAEAAALYRHRPYCTPTDTASSDGFATKKVRLMTYGSTRSPSSEPDGQAFVQDKVAGDDERVGLLKLMDGVDLRNIRCASRASKRTAHCGTGPIHGDHGGKVE